MNRRTMAELGTAQRVLAREGGDLRAAMRSRAFRADVIRWLVDRHELPRSGTCRCASREMNDGRGEPTDGGSESGRRDLSTSGGGRR